MFLSIGYAQSAVTLYIYTDWRSYPIRSLIPYKSRIKIQLQTWTVQFGPIGPV